MQYHAGPWGGCNSLCGKGIRKRLVTCYETNENGTIVKLEDEECSNLEELKKPEEEEECEEEETNGGGNHKNKTVKPEMIKDTSEIFEF